MAKLKWDQSGKRYYETGIENGVLYVKGESGYGTGVAWNGLVSVSESPSGGEANAQYADNIKYLNLISSEDFGCSVECFTYPSQFNSCLGIVDAGNALTTPTPKGILLTQQKRSQFGFVYKTRIGNDEDGDSHGYKIHIVYGCLAAPSSPQYSTINDSPEAITFSFEISTTPEAIETEGYKPTAHIVIDSTIVPEATLTSIENSLFGTDGTGSTGGTDPTILLPDEIIDLLS